MKPIRFALHYLGMILYKLVDFLWAPVLVFTLWCTIGYLLSRLTIFRDGFTKGTSDWYMTIVSPLVIVGVISAVLFLATVVVIVVSAVVGTSTYIRSSHPINRLKKAYRNFK